MSLPDRRRSRAVLVGVGSYEHEGLRSYPEIRQNVMDLYKLLTDPDCGTFLPQYCDVLLDVADQNRLGDKLQAAAEEAEDLLLVYYAGHGLLDEKRRELHLALSTTKPSERVIGFSALPFARVRDACHDSAARSRIVILDCCYSGRAIYGTQSNQTGEVLAQIDVSGTYTLTSSPANDVSVVVPGESHTAFTGRLLRILREEGSAGPDLLTLSTLFKRLQTSLNADGLPRPLQCTTENAEQIALVRPYPADDPRGGRGEGPGRLEHRALAAKAQADEILRIVREQSDALTRQATAEADLIRRTAELAAERARQTAADTRAKSEAEALMLRQQAEMTAAETVAGAEQVMREARERAGELLDEAAMQHGRKQAEYDTALARLQAEIGDLNAERERLAGLVAEPSAGAVAEIREHARRFVVDPEALRDIDEAIDHAISYARALRQQADTHYAYAQLVAAKDAAARRAEAEAHYEDIRASAAAAATDFETKLLKRREQSDHDLAARQAKAEKLLAEVETRSEQIRLEAEKMRTDAESGVRQTFETAQRQADDIVADARAKADRVRSEAERELAALTHRRDSINARLHNVREILAALNARVGGNVPGLSELLSALEPRETAPQQAAEPAVSQAKSQRRFRRAGGS